VSAARDEILRRVRGALGAARPEAPALPAFTRAGSLDAAGRIALFAERVADYRAEVRRDGLGALTDLAGGQTLGVPAGLPSAWRPPGAVQDDGLTVAQLDALDGVVTGCTVAIAETGTLVLSGQPHEGRRALTLVPDLHICIVEEDRIVETVPEAFDRLAAHATRPLTFVSGPSATSDIELKRIEGVHGPRRLVVLIVEGGEGDG
jgi:L-lactate dehydrogenase complex protein LldG